ncbi:MAG: acylphosphatase [Allosphingosinicella sp.]|uniref:acylphosphatase n=1 Tax=Allosphingosinicella sp. TaxID=2823234 RepID=UPI0039340B8D
MTSEPGRRLRIRGRVQGVFYRNWMVNAARDLGLAGWVRNRSDGSVEAEAFGPIEALDRLVALCREGPPAAEVTGIESEAAHGPAPAGFEKRPTL